MVIKPVPEMIFTTQAEKDAFDAIVAERDSLRAKLDDAIRQRDLLQSACDNYMKALDDCRAKLDASERANAEMRGTLEMLEYRDYDTAKAWPTRHVRDTALRSDAGRDYVPKADLESLQRSFDYCAARLTDSLQKADKEIFRLRAEVGAAWRKGMTDAAMIARRLEPD